ncbi:MULTISPECIES: O-antigen ligase [unclassified Rossellomorea]|uniref:O-antigen ligase family protein n=1 Tax=unclassified Rossellomorea TaxID=2837526 RepID=UPI002610568C|nr:O-antigen ligase family protein [uncultured Rossellomorea sp.]
MNFSTLMNKYEPRVKQIILILVAGYLFFAQFSTQAKYIKLLPVPVPAVLTLGVGSLLFLYYVLNRKRLTQTSEFDKYLKRFLILFLISLALAILSAFYTATVLNSVEYMSYLKSSMITRLAYYLSFFMFVYFGYRLLVNEPKDNASIIKVYPLSILLLVAVAFWQLAYFMFNIPFLNLNTRSFVHSVEGVTLFDFRITSFTNEPSYMGPFLIDLIILAFLFVKRKWVYAVAVLIPTLFILAFTFSVSAYFNLVLVIGFLMVYLMFHPKFPKKILWMIPLVGIIGIAGLYLVNPDLLAKFFSPIWGRRDNLFDPTQSSRIYMYVMPFQWLFDHSIISGLFGYGPGAYEFLAGTKIVPHTQMSLAISANNMFIDVLFEQGVIGLLLLLTGLISIAVFLLKNGMKNMYYFIALVEYFHLMVTSLYRADYVTPRFWAVLLVIAVLVKIGEMKHKDKLNVTE